MTEYARHSVADLLPPSNQDRRSPARGVPRPAAPPPGRMLITALTSPYPACRWCVWVAMAATRPLAYRHKLVHDHCDQHQDLAWEPFDSARWLALRPALPALIPEVL